MDQPSKILFILPTFNQFSYAKRSLDTFARYTSDPYCVVVDDGSQEWYEHLLNWPVCRKFCIHFLHNDGLTRSWNEGLRLARDCGFKYTICGNSDILFTRGWHEPLIEALESGVDLVGPVTNAPGHAPWQDVNRYAKFPPTDRQSALNHHAELLRYYPQRRAIPARFINGFFLMAKTVTWWNGAFDSEHVFNPRYKLTGNEDELQARWIAQGKLIGFSPRSFVFHYRSISRPEALNTPVSRGAYRGGSHEGSGRHDRVHAH